MKRTLLAAAAGMLAASSVAEGTANQPVQEMTGTPFMLHTDCWTQAVIMDGHLVVLRHACKILSQYVPDADSDLDSPDDTV